MPVDEDDEDGLNEFLPSDVDPGAQSDASNASAPEKGRGEAQASGQEAYKETQR